MRKSLRLLLGVLVLLPVITVMLAAGRVTNANATATVELTGAVVKITSVQTSRPGFDHSTTPPSTRYRWVRVWLYGLNFTRQTLTLQCKLDKAAWAQCGAFKAGSSYRTFKGVAPGLHTIRVRLVDSAGNVVPPVSVYPYGMKSVEEAPTVFSWFVTSAAVPAPTPPPTGTPKRQPPAAPLIVGVDDDGSVSLWDGKRYPQILKPGHYAITAIDDSKRHNIHVVAVGVNLRTSVPAATPQGRSYSVTTVVWRVTLKPGKLSIYSDRAPSKRISINVSKN